MKPPKPIGVGPVRIRVRRGPRADGRWYWRADRQAGSERVDVWLGWGTPDEATAEVIARLARQGEGPGAVPMAEQVRTVRDLLECWVASQDARKDISPITARNGRMAAARIIETIGGVLVERVDRRVVERHRDQAGDAGATIARDLKYFRQAWRWGREVGACPERELPSVRVVRQEPVRTRYTPDRVAVARVIARVREHSEGAWRGIVLLAVTGGRPSEVARVGWDDVSADCTRLVLEGKTGPRTVHLHSLAAEELRSWVRTPGGRVCGVATNTIREHLAEACTELGLPRLSPTGLRRYVVRLRYRRAADLAAGADQMGHSIVTALSVYHEVLDEDRDEAVEAAGLSVPSLEDGEVVELAQVLAQRERRGR